MQTVHTRAELRAWQADHPGSLGFVPTMGNLHAGHLALVRAAKAENARTAVSIFVNPTQFGPQEDFAAYPRTLAADAAVLDEAGCDLLFAPQPDAIYPPGCETLVLPGPTAETLCGAFRPGHFRGVATVVTTLWQLLRPTRAYFGSKDWQQGMVLRRLLLDLAFPIEMVLCPTVREPDGLAMSSRNQYLSASERRHATRIHEALQAGAAAFEQEEQRPDLLRQLTLEILSQDDVLRPQYVAVADAETLQPVETFADRPLVIAIAAFLGRTRLIDNVVLGDAAPLLRSHG